MQVAVSALQVMAPVPGSLGWKLPGGVAEPVPATGKLHADGAQAGRPIEDSDAATQEFV